MLLTLLRNQSSGGAYVLSAAAAVFSLTCNDAGLNRQLQLQADSGAFVLTGQDAGLNVGRKVVADSAAFVLIGQDAGINKGRSITADSESFAFSGQAAGLLVGRTIQADSGAFVLTGNDAILLYTGIVFYNVTINFEPSTTTVNCGTIELTFVTLDLTAQVTSDLSTKITITEAVKPLLTFG